MTSAPAGGKPAVALALDVHYLPWAATLIRSCVLVHSSDELQIEIVHDGSIRDLDQARLRSIAGTGATVNFRMMPVADLAGLPTTPAFGVIVWLRFFLPDILDHLGRVLYLDADTFVLSSLSELWRTSLDGRPIAAVSNVVEPSLRTHVRDLGVTYPGGFFNSGVLMLDLDLMRRQNTTEKLLRFAVDHRDRLVWPDQDVLNAVFREDWLPLHPRWNAQNSLWFWRDWAVEVFGETAVGEAISAPGVRHFEGPSIAKPWHYLSYVPWRKEYLRALRSTPWARTPLVDRTPATSVIRLLPRRAQVRAYSSLIRHRSQRQQRKT